MRLPWGGLEAQALGAWDRLAGQVREWDGTAIISHEILATASRGAGGQRRSPRSATRDAEVHVVLSVRDLVRQIPAEWQENVKHRARAAATPASCRPDPGPGPREPDRHLVLGGPGDPRHPRPLGPRPAARAGPPGHRAAARRAARSCSGSGSARRFGLDGLDLDLEARAREPVARCAGDRAAAADQPRGPTRRRAGPTTGRWCASCSPTRPCRGGSDSPRLALPPDAYPWAQELTGAWIDEIKRARVRRGRRPRRPGRRRRPASRTPTPTIPTRARSPTPRSTRSRRCCWRTPGCCETEQRLRRELDEARPALERPTCDRRTGCARAVVRRLERSRFGRGLLAVYRGARGRSSRSA